MENEYFGKMTRYLIENQNKSRPTPKEEFKDLLSLSHRAVEDMVPKLQELFLNPMGLELVGITQNEIVSPAEGKKLFLRRLYEDHPKKAKTVLTEEDRRLFTVFAAIQLENNRLEESRLAVLKASYLFGERVAEFLDRCRQRGYLTTRKDKEVAVWSLGWRFYVDYGDCFDIVEYFRELSR